MAKQEQQYVTVEQFKELSDNVSTLVDLMTKQATPATPVATPEPAKAEEKIEPKAVEKAAPNRYTVNPEWEDMAKEIIGEAVDHTELQYLKGGGLTFTVVLKQEFSNAPKDYLERYKQDRRTCEVGTTGEVGVKIWCEQIRANLKRSAAH